MAKKETSKKVTTKKEKNIEYYEAIGRRKSSIARVRLYITSKQKEIKSLGLEVKQGEIVVNKLAVEKYFDGMTDSKKYLLPLELTDNVKRFAITAVVNGGGKQGQLDAVILGVARALEKVDGNYRALLKADNLLTRDARSRERRKAGTGGRARRQKQSPKR